MKTPILHEIFTYVSNPGLPYWYTIWIQELGLYLIVLPVIYLFVIVLLIQLMLFSICAAMLCTFYSSVAKIHKIS